jgi:hypothetical protein
MPKTMSINNSAMISPPPVVSAFQRASKYSLPILGRLQSSGAADADLRGMWQSPWVIPQGAFRVAQWATA